MKRWDERMVNSANSSDVDRLHAPPTDKGEHGPRRPTLSTTSVYDGSPTEAEGGNDFGVEEREMGLVPQGEEEISRNTRYPVHQRGRSASMPQFGDFDELCGDEGCEYYPNNMTRGDSNAGQQARPTNTQFNDDNLWNAASRATPLGSLFPSFQPPPGLAPRPAEEVLPSFTERKLKSQHSRKSSTFHNQRRRATVGDATIEQVSFPTEGESVTDVEDVVPNRGEVTSPGPTLITMLQALTHVSGGHWTDGTWIVAQPNPIVSALTSDRPQRSLSLN